MWLRAREESEPVDQDAPPQPEDASGKHGRQREVFIPLGALEPISRMPFQEIFAALVTIVDWIADQAELDAEPLAEGHTKGSHTKL